jgi:Icc-related predicted phosphoesterase
MFCRNHFGSERSIVKLLLFSDLHCDAAAARKIAERASRSDVLVGAGDFASVRRRIGVCIKVLRTIPKPAVLVPGNNESLDELQIACRDWPQARVLHGSGITIEGVQFYGLGGGVPVTPFGPWSFDFTEEQAAALLADCPSHCVLVTHSPPKGVVDGTSVGCGYGSTAVREAILKKSPRLVVCGHIHECGGVVESLGATPVINAGPKAIEWELGSLEYSDSSPL